VVRNYSKIAVIGPKDIVADCLSLQVNYPNLLLEDFVYESEKETTSIINNLPTNVDLLLFAGPVPYMQAFGKELLSSIPHTYIPYHGTALLRALFQAQKLQETNNYSIDTVNLKLLLEAFSELGITDLPKYITEFTYEQDSMDLVNYHTKLFQEGKTKGAITSLASCHQELLKIEVPSIKIKPFKSVISDTLDKVKLICDSIHNKENQISVGFISVNGFEKWSQEKKQQEIQEFEIQLESSVLNFVKELDGQYVQTTPREFLYFTTRAFIDNATKGFSSLPSIFHKSNLPRDIKLNLGIGMGGTTNLAATSAKIAVEKVREIGGDCCFIVNENQELIEIFKGTKETKRLELRTTDQLIIDMAEQSNLSAKTLRKVFFAIQQVGDEFTANEIAPFLALTVKSTQRILRKLKEGRVIIVVGKEALQSRGKPRQVFQLKK
jgi:hypothetical protein